MTGLAMRTTARRWRGLGVGVGLGCGLGRWPGRLRQQENIPEVAQRLARSMPQAVIADPGLRRGRLFWKPAGWTCWRKRRMNSWPATVCLRWRSAARSLVAVGHSGVVDGQDAVVGDGDAEGVAGEIVERCLLSLAPWRDVNDPGDLPDMGRQVGGR